MQVGFTPQGFYVLRLPGVAGMHDLYGHDPVQDGIPGPVDGPLAASGYPLEYLVSADTVEHGCREL